jgi:pantoate--beta-alanine ligase
MEIIEKPAELTAKIIVYKKFEKRIGFVPTMGYLHEGHLSLVKKAKTENDIVVVSIFVNPTQFGPQEDLSKYPRDLVRDKKLLESAGADIIFHPQVEDIYPIDHPPRKLHAEKSLISIACGTSRPGHFDGVVTVVARLFDIIKPQCAYFGLKDYQQFLVIKKMAEKEKYPLEIIGCPLIREKDGLAMSSRNSYLSKTEKQNALILYRSLRLAQSAIKSGEKDLTKIKEKIRTNILTVPEARIDYIEIADRETLRPLQNYISEKAIILLAVFIGKTRLIDNLFI